MQDSIVNKNNEVNSITTKVVVIGASTGGPQALLKIFEDLPSVISVPIVVAQHMISEFLPQFVNSLSNDDINLKFELGEQNKALEAGRIYIAPGGSNMTVKIDNNGTKRLEISPSTAVLRPSIDMLMTSVANTYGANSLGIILSGMGKDGLEGMRAIKTAGGETITQDKDSSVVYGMAQAVNDQNLADFILPLPSIAGAIFRWSNTK